MAIRVSISFFSIIFLFVYLKGNVLWYILSFDEEESWTMRSHFRRTFQLASKLSNISFLLQKLLRLLIPTQNPRQNHIKFTNKKKINLI